MVVKETLTGYSRLLHKYVKETHAEFKALGYPADTVDLLLLNVMMRVAYEERGEEGVRALLTKLKALDL